MSLLHSRRVRLAIAGVAAAFVAATCLSALILLRAWPESPIHVHVRWKPGVTEAQRVELESRFRLTSGESREEPSWEYLLADSSTGNIRAIVQDERVDDTEHLNRIRFRPEFAQDRLRRILAYSVASGGFVAAAFLLVAMRSRQFAWMAAAPASEVVAAVSRTLAPGSLSGIGIAAPVGTAEPERSTGTRQTAFGAIVGGILLTAAMSWLAGTSVWSAAGALVVVYVGGYVVGAFLVHPANELSWTVIRTVAGLLLTSTVFLLSLVLSLPWFLLPAGLVAAAVWFHGVTAFSPPKLDIRVSRDGVAAGVLVAILLAPVALTFFYMAPGRFPPVFYNVDTAYFAEKVHALVAADGYPPESLSNLGIRRSYHYGTQATAALISRSSGMLPHQALFLIVLPLLTAGVAAAAAAAARQVGPGLPLVVTIPLLLLGDYSLWGAVGDTGLFQGFNLSNEGQNIGGDFVVLASIAGIAAAPARGWSLPAFLIGSAILVKTPIGIALVAGFVLADAWRAVVAKRAWPSAQLVAVGLVAATTFVAFFLVSFDSEYRVELAPFSHVSEIVAGGNAFGPVVDALWLFLPVFIVLTAGIVDTEGKSAPILLMAVAPVIVMNATRLDNVSTGGGGTGGDWIQILHPLPFFVHAFALSLASRRWGLLGRGRRAAFLLTAGLAIVPAAAGAARYSSELLRHPESGNDYVDNRALAGALAVVPTSGTVVVTNDLRYPAQNFARDDRQMQIPALFGHQAFAVNYAHEAVEERRPLQQLLQQPEWNDSITEAARRYGWTHLLIRKDYPHPEPIPLERVFDDELYAVFRFR